VRLRDFGEANSGDAAGASPFPRIARVTPAVVFSEVPAREAFPMSFLYSISPLSREGLTVLATVVVSLFVLWLCGIFSRRRFIVIKKSEETELIAYHLRRIADALERLSTTQEVRPPAEVNAGKRAMTSTLGR
jgi:hypothetical protein